MKEGHMRRAGRTIWRHGWCVVRTVDMLNENLTLSEPDPPLGPVRLSWNPTFQGRYKTCRGSAAHESVANRQNSVLCAATGEVDIFAAAKVASRGYSNCGYYQPPYTTKTRKEAAQNDCLVQTPVYRVSIKGCLFLKTIAI